MIDFTSVKKWIIGSDEVVKAYLNGTLVWGKGSISRTTWTNTQAPSSLSGLGDWYRFSPAITISGVGKLRITVTRLKVTSEHTSSGVTFFPAGLNSLTSNNTQSPTKVQSLGFPTSVGATSVTDITLDDSQTYTYYLCCEPRGYNSGGDRYGYVPSGEFRFDIDVVG